MAHAGTKDFSTRGVIKHNFGKWKGDQLVRENFYGVSWAAQGGAWNPIQWYNIGHRLNRQRKLVKSLRRANDGYERLKNESPDIREIGHNALTGAIFPKEIKAMDQLLGLDNSRGSIQLDPVHQMQALMGSKDSIARRDPNSNVKPADADKLEVLAGVMKEGERKYFEDGLINVSQAQTLEAIINQREHLLAEYGFLTRQMLSKGRTPELIKAERELLERSRSLRKMATDYGGLLKKLQIEWVARQRYYKLRTTKRDAYGGKGFPERVRAGSDL
ncbi:MAG: hypothetical protein ABIH20_01350 [Candidatus Diapherotrites archaeon]